jgi:cytochrome c biogenesis protein CcmG/thiol:disulfide interchange protein DsbE
MTHVNAGQAAPDFSLKGLDGQIYSLDEVRRRGPIVAAFFKISCPVCQFTFPFLQRLYERYGGEDVTFLGISQDEAKATAGFAKQYGITFPMALDEKEKGYPASNAYGLTSVPTIFLIDPEGIVHVSSMGFVKQDLEEIAAALAERRKIDPAALFRAHESVPANRPG